MDEITRNNIRKALESAKADLLQALAKIEQNLDALGDNSATVTTDRAEAAPLLIDVTLTPEYYNSQDEDDDYYDDDRYDYYGDEAEVDNTPTAVTYDVAEDGTVVESEGADEAFARAAEIVAQNNERQADVDDPDYDEEYADELLKDRIELTFVKLSEDEDEDEDITLTSDEVHKVLQDRFTRASLANFGNLALATIRQGDSDASQVAVFRILSEGRASTEAIAQGIMSYRGTHVFPGIGNISVVGRAVFAQK